MEIKLKGVPANSVSVVEIDRLMRIIESAVTLGQYVSIKVNAFGTATVRIGEV